MLRVSKQLLSAQNLRGRWVKLTMFSAPILGAYFYGYMGYSSPLFCPFKALTGIPCPSCGMTRSFLAIAKGNLPEAINYHLFGIVLFLAFLITIIHLAVEIVTKRKITTLYSRLIQKERNLIIFLTIFLIYYLFRLYNWGISGNLIIDFKSSPLANFIY